jgi:exopolysaccharide biosynthesis polyprenyl glycosylphosphotransferase
MPVGDVAAVTVAVPWTGLRMRSKKPTMLVVNTLPMLLAHRSRPLCTVGFTQAWGTAGGAGHVETGDLTITGAHQAATDIFGDLPLGVAYERRERPRRRSSDVFDRDGVAESSPHGAAARRDAVFRRLLALADVVAAGTAVALTGLLVAPHHLGLLSVLALPLVVLAAKVVGLYDRDELVVHKTTLNEAPHLFPLTAVITVLFSALQSAANGTDATASTLLVLWALLLGGMVVARWTARRVARELTPKERCVLVGDVTHAARVRRLLANHPSLSAELVASIPFRRVTARGEDAEQFGAYLARSGFHRVIVTHADADAGDMLETIRVFKSRGIKVSVLPTLFDVVGSAVEFDDLAGVTLLGVRRYGLSRSSQFLKRSMDVVVAALALVVVAPLFALIAAAIRLDSDGPVFFRQERVGRRGRHFRIWKFRTMVPDAERAKQGLLLRNETNGLFKIADDPRVTRVGRFLRKTSLDELPQLLNVLAGEMSLVGPRPLVADEDRRIDGWQRRRLDLTPGLTGAWQTLAATRVPLEDMVSLDYLYIVNWSLWSDVEILLRTIPHVLNRRNL